jgi:dihydrolipoamide dehydrogenase
MGNLSMPDHDVDLVVLGGGSGGYAAALRAADLGRSVVLIEKDRLGGTCLHRGCIPTKALLHAGEIADTTREAIRFGVNSQFHGVDMTAVHKYMREVIDKNWNGLAGLIRSRGVTVVEEHGVLVGDRAVRAGEHTYVGSAVVLATGSRPRSLPGIIPDGKVILLSDDVLARPTLPESAVILGGGVIGCEFASAWTSLGIEVTVVEAREHLVPTEDEFSSRLLERAFRRRGIAFHLSSAIADISSQPDGVRVRLASGSVVAAEVVLVAVGRMPVTEGLGFTEHGINIDANGFVVIDEFGRTSAPGIYAVGDLVPTPQLAHVGFAEGIVAAEHLAGLVPDPVWYEGVPRVTYTSPEIASVGLTEPQARRRHGSEAVQVVTYDLSGNGRSAILRTSGAVKLVALADGTVVGVHMVGDRVSELVAEAQLIVNWQAMAADVAGLIHPHPTQSEALGEAHLLLAGKPLHVH